MKKNIPVILDGVRTPFVESGGAFTHLSSCDLGAIALQGLMDKGDIDPEKIDMVSMGTLVHEVQTPNIARDAMLAAGMSSTTPAYTTSMGGLSPNVALTGLCDKVALGRINTGVAAGTDSFSDISIRLSPNLRRALTGYHFNKSLTGLLKRLRPRDVMLDIPRDIDFTTKKNMGTHCEKMAKKFNVQRTESDEFSSRSHANAIRAWESGRYKEDIINVKTETGNICRDDSPRPDTTMKKLAELRPVFDKKDGIITAGNASRFTDGAASILISSLDAAESLGKEPLAAIRDYVFSGVADLETEMLCGPAMVIPKLLKKNTLSIDDIDVWELHEAFAAQILVNQKCLASSTFSKTYLGMDSPVGSIPIEKLNTWGGSLALGNPFSTTGLRLIITASRRLKAENRRYGIVSSCAGGGMGCVILLENANFL